MKSVTTELPRRPAPPAGMPVVARRTWKAILNDYRPDHFTAANLVILEQLCRARALVAQCDRRLAHGGLLIKGGTRPNPLLGVRAQAWSEIRACATKLRIAISGTVRAEAAAARPDENAGRRKPWLA